jgi:hypothetical protein
MMKKLLFLGLLSILLVAFCGAPPEGGTEVTTEGTGVDVAYGKLTEGELQKFMKVFPVAKDEIEKSGKEFGGDNENIESMLGQFATVNKDVVGLDAKLAAAGMPWNEFWPAFAKTWTASIAVMMSGEMAEMEEGMAEMKKQLEDPKIPDAQKEMMKAALGAMEQMKKVADKVPQGNKDVVQKHWDELTKLFDMD